MKMKKKRQHESKEKRKKEKKRDQKSKIIIDTFSKCNQDSNHSLSKHVSSKILGNIDLCIYGGNNFFITSLGFLFFIYLLEK